MVLRRTEAQFYKIFFKNHPSGQLSENPISGFLTKSYFSFSKDSYVDEANNLSKKQN